MTAPLSRRAASLRRSDVRDLLRHAASPDGVSLAGGLPAPELFDFDGVRAAATAALADAPRAALQYGMTEGQPALRSALAAHLAAQGVSAGADDLVVTAGSQQGLDLVARALIDDGDTVVVERPSYLAALQALALAGARFATVGIDRDGACVDELAALDTAPAPKLAYVVANFANPSGATLSLERRRALVRWAAARRVFVLEDDPYGALRSRGEAPPSLLALASAIPGATDWVGYASTLSKTVAPGLRVGWLVLPRWLREAVVRVKQAADLHTGTLAQEVACAYLASGRLPARLELVRAEYAARRDALASALHHAFGARLAFEVPDGGMFLWARFTDGTDTRALLSHALERGVTFVPGDAFFADRPDPGTLRLNFSACGAARLCVGVARLAEAHGALHREATSSAGSAPRAEGGAASPR